MRPDTPANLKNLDKGYQEIPTIPSTLSRLGKELQKFDLEEINSRLASILGSIDDILKDPNIKASLSDLDGLLKDARGLVNNVNGQVDPLADNLNRTISDAKLLIDDVDKQVKPLAEKAGKMMDDIDKLSRDVDTKLDPLTKSVIDAFDAAKAAFQSVDELVGKKSPTRADLETALQELALAARSLRTLADYLEQHPDSLLKGKGYKNY
jgi:paraquat-inducible protein B